MARSRLRPVLTTALLLAPVCAQANPLNGTVVGGSASIQQTAPKTLTITQTTPNTIINWYTFNISAGETTQFVQPNASAIALNRVTGGLGPSQIWGTITANGKVFLVNPDGILFGAGSKIDAAGFLASTNDIKNSDFMKGKYVFNIPGRLDASIVNFGQITAASGGFAALVAPGVRNAGTITANLGHVALASGNGFTLDFYGDQLITLQVGDKVAATVKDVATGLPLDALVKNEGVLQANGGQVALTAVSARTVVDAVIKNTGTIEANSVGTKNGMIVLGAQTKGSKGNGIPTQKVVVSGTLSAKGSNSGEKGGTIQVTGESITLANAHLDASGPAGGGAVLIGGDTGGGASNAATGGMKQAALQPWPVATASTVTIDSLSTINASATANGDGGKVVVWSSGVTTVAGLITASGGSLGGNGGFVETSGQTLNFAGLSVDTSAPKGVTGLWLVDPASLTVDAASAATISGNLANTNVTLNASAPPAGDDDDDGNKAPVQGGIFINSGIAWASANTLSLDSFQGISINAPITGLNGGFTLNAQGSIGAIAAVNVGTFTLQNGNWQQLAANLPDFSAADFRITGGTFLRALGGDGTSAPYLITDIYGLQGIGSPSGTLLNKSFALNNDIDASGTGGWNGGAGFVPIGNGKTQFGGTFDGQGHVVDALSINSSAQYAGLFGYIGGNGTVSNLGLTNASVLTTGGSQFVGALAGANNGFVFNSYSAGQVGNFGDAPAPNGTAGAYGGLVGFNGGFVSQSYSTAMVQVNGPVKSGYVDGGGLVGQNQGTITDSYASGPVNGTNGSPDASYLGGLVGWNDGGNISHTYATGSVAGTGSFISAGGLVGTNDGNVATSYAIGSVSTVGADANSLAGGLVGLNTASVTQSYATGAVSGSASAGGLAGENTGSIAMSYALGPVMGGNSGGAGGLVGVNVGTIDQTWASGAVSGGEGSTTGGLVGLNSLSFGGGGVGGAQALTTIGTVTESYWDKQTTGQLHSAGSADSFGLTTAQSMQHTSYVGWNFNLDGGTWFMVDGATRPFLQSEWSSTIINTHQLQLMALDLNAHYTLANNLSFGTSFTNPSDMWGSQGFVPIGGAGTPFAGWFNGQGNQIDGLKISPTDPHVTSIGMFGANSGTIENIQLTNAAITVNPNAGLPGQFVGTLVGQNFGMVSNAWAGGHIDGLDVAGVNAGGLVGQNGMMGLQTQTADIANSHADVTVTLGDGISCIGGGCNGGMNNAGGLVGFNVATIENSSASGNVTVGANTFAGGLVGANQNASFDNESSQPTALKGPVIVDSSASGNVSSAGLNVVLGGLVGYNAPLATITTSFATGHVTSTATIKPSHTDCSTDSSCEYANVGGLVGQNQGTITGNTQAPTVSTECGFGQTCAGGAVSVGSGGTAGGLAGTNDGIIQNAFASGAVTGAAGQGNGSGSLDNQTSLGGLVGQNQGLIDSSFAKGNVGTAGVAFLQAGGLVASNNGLISNSIAIGAVQAGDHSQAGGLVAENHTFDNTCANCVQGDAFSVLTASQFGAITNSQAFGNVTVGDSSIAGGLVGSSGKFNNLPGVTGTIEHASASGNVTGGVDSILGGLAGITDLGTTIDDHSQASGAVKSTGASSIAGGFIGVNGGQIMNSQASGAVNGTSSSFLGGFVGINVGLVQDSTSSGNVAGSGSGNIVGGFVAVNAGTIDPSFSTGSVSSGADSIVGGFAGANVPFANLPPGLNLNLNLNFPGSIDPASGQNAGPVTAGPGSVTGPRIAIDAVTSGFPSTPPIVTGCTTALCEIIIAGLTPGSQPPPVLPPPVLPPPDIQNGTPQIDLPPIQQVVPPVPNQNDNNPNLVNLTTGGSGSGSGSGGNGAGGGNKPINYGPPPGQGLDRTLDEQRYSGVPPPFETRYRVGEVVVQISDIIPISQVVDTAAKIGMTLVSSEHLERIHRVLYRFRVFNGKDIRVLIAALERNKIIASAQPNYVFTPAQTAPAETAPAQTAPAQSPPAPATRPDVEQTESIPPASEPTPGLANSDTAALESLPAGDAAQYVIDKLHLGAVHRLASGRNVTIAVVDSEIDVAHPDLRGVIADRYDATQSPSHPHAHGTGMAGAIASRTRLLGIAPGARIIAIKAFDESASSAEATSYQIIKGLDYAITKKVRIINMSFAGPRDLMMERTLKTAHDKGIILVAAAGNAGPKSPPLYPGADESVIAVTATDYSDKPFAMANRGKYIAVAAPGVDVMVPAPANTYQLTTGTSVAAAHVSGVAALLVERKPNITPDEVRAILTHTAIAFTNLPKGEQDGAGLVDPAAALRALGADKSVSNAPAGAPASASVH